jgi:hypothetical protein
VIEVLFVESKKEKKPVTGCNFCNGSLWRGQSMFCIGVLCDQEYMLWVRSSVKSTSVHVRPARHPHEEPHGQPKFIHSFMHSGYDQFFDSKIK